MIDRLDNTYMHTQRGKAINSANPLTLIFDLGKIYYFDYISIQQGGNNYYLPAKLTISTSEDKETWIDEKEYRTTKSGNSAIINLEEKLHTRYIKLHITEAATSPFYIAIKSIDFIEQGVKFYQKPPEFPDLGGELGNIEINFNNFPYYGHSYILKENNYLTFTIEDCVGIRIKVCNKFDSQIALIIDTNEEEKEIINVLATDELDFPIDKRSLIKGNHSFKIEVKEGKLDFEYLLYQM